MPYASNDELPKEVRNRYSSRCQTVFREAFNGHDGTEESKFKVAHTAARNCMDSSMTHMPMKAEQLGSAKWRVLAIPFGGPFKGGKDTDGEFFSPRTDIKADWFQTRPVIWHHGMDPLIKDADLGTEDDLEKTDEGWWATMWLNRESRYWEEVNKRLAAGKMFGSSGAIAHLVQKDHKTGEILRWPHAEQTLTPTPANFFSRVIASKAVDRLTPEGVRELLSDLDPADDLRPDLRLEGDAMADAKLRLTGMTDLLLERLKSI